jgi:hypothetical protein
MTQGSTSQSQLRDESGVSAAYVPHVSPICYTFPTGYLFSIYSRSLKESGGKLTTAFHNCIVREKSYVYYLKPSLIHLTITLWESYLNLVLQEPFASKDSILDSFKFSKITSPDTQLNQLNTRIEYTDKKINKLVFELDWGKERGGLWRMSEL